MIDFPSSIAFYEDATLRCASTESQSKRYAPGRRYYAVSSPIPASSHTFRRVQPSISLLRFPADNSALHTSHYSNGNVGCLKSRRSGYAGDKSQSWCGVRWFDIWLFHRRLYRSTAVATEKQQGLYGLEGAELLANAKAPVVASDIPFLTADSAVRLAGTRLRRRLSGSCEQGRYRVINRGCENGGLRHPSSKISFEGELVIVAVIVRLA